MDTGVIIRQLEYEADKHKNDRLFTGQTNITALCRDLIPKMKELKRYEDLEQDGRLLEVPCKVGDIVWYLQEQYSGKWIAKPATVSSFQFDRFLRIYCIEERQNTQAFWEEDFGKSVFLTEEAAEAALKEMEGKA